MPELVELTYQGDGGALAVVRLNRPPVNALDHALHEDLLTVVRELAGSADLRAVVLHGGPRAFAAGADIREMADLDADSIGDFGRSLSAALEGVAALPVPVIAAVTGYALGGGCELALAADLRIIAEDARIGLPEITLGIIPGAGGTQRLARLVGPARAKELIFTGRSLSGVEAVQWGIATLAVPADEVLPTAMRWADRCAAGPTRALRAAKEAIDTGLGGPLADGLALEARLFAGLFGTADQAAGMRSFLEQGPGKAEFSGR